MCRYMRLPIAFQDNQQISLADSTVWGRVGSKELLQDVLRLCLLLGKTYLGLSTHFLLFQSLFLSLSPPSMPLLPPSPSYLARLFIPF